MTEAPDWVTLTDDEEVIWEGRPTLIHYMVGLWLPVVLIVIGVGIWLVTAGAIGIGVSIPAAVPGGLIGAVIVLVGLLLAARSLLEWWSVRFLLTTEEVYKKRGLLSRHVQNIRLDQIQNTSFSQPLSGRLLSYGHVYIDTAGSGGTEMAFRNVPNPEEVVGSLTEALDRQRF